MGSRCCLLCHGRIKLQERDTYRHCRSESNQAQCLTRGFGLQPLVFGGGDAESRYLYNKRAVFCLNCVRRLSCHVCGVFHCHGCASFQRSQGHCGPGPQPRTTLEGKHELMGQCESCHNYVCSSCSTTCAECKETSCSHCINHQDLVFSNCHDCTVNLHDQLPLFCLEPKSLCQRCYSRGIRCTDCNSVIPEPEAKLRDLMVAVASIPFPFHGQPSPFKVTCEPKVLHHKIFMMAFGERFKCLGASRGENEAKSLEKMRDRFMRIMDYNYVKHIRRSLPITPFYPIQITRRPIQGIPWHGAKDPTGSWVWTLEMFAREVHAGLHPTSKIPTLNTNSLVSTSHIAQAIEHGRTVDLYSFFVYLGIPLPSYYLWIRVTDVLAGLDIESETTNALSNGTLSFLIERVSGRRMFAAGTDQRTNIWTNHDRYIYVIIRLYISLRRASLV